MLTKSLFQFIFDDKIFILYLQKLMVSSKIRLFFRARGRGQNQDQLGFSDLVAKFKNPPRFPGLGRHPECSTRGEKKQITVFKN